MGDNLWYPDLGADSVPQARPNCGPRDQLCSKRLPDHHLNIPCYKLTTQVVKGDPAVLDLDPVAVWQEVKDTLMIINR